MRYFSDIGYNFLKKKKCKFKRKDLCLFNKIITGYAYTQFIFKIGVVDSPTRSCGMAEQDLNHIF